MFKIDINIIDNKEGRNEIFLPLFISMSKQGYGKLLENWYFCINTNLQLGEIKSKEELIFTNLQKYSAIKGIETNMFIIKTDEK